jgi:hypothetical protein
MNNQNKSNLPYKIPNNSSNPQLPQNQIFINAPYLVQTMNMPYVLPNQNQMIMNNQYRNIMMTQMQMQMMNQQNMMRMMGSQQQIRPPQMQMMPMMQNSMPNRFANPYNLSNTSRMPPSGSLLNQPYTNKQVNHPYFNNGSFNNANNFQSTHQHLPQYNFEKRVETTPEEKEEIRKWIEARKRNFPTTMRIEEKIRLDKRKEEKGMLSKLELKLREKIRFISNFDNNSKFGRNNRDRNNRFKRGRRGRQKHHSKRNNEIKNNEAPEEGEILEEKEFDLKNEENSNKDNLERRAENKKNKNKEQNRKIIKRIGFRYRRNNIIENLMKYDKYKEMNVILQCFRYFVNEKLI